MLKRPEPKGISKKASIAKKVKWAVEGAAKDTVKNAVSLVVPSVKAGSAAAKIGDKVAQKVAETRPAPKLGKAGGEIKTVRINPKEDITIRRDVPGDRRTTPGKVVSVDKPKSATYTTRENSMKQRISVEQNMTKQRNADIESAAKAGTKAAEPEVNKLANTGTKGLNVYRGIDAVKTAKGTQKDHYVTGRKDSTKKVKGD